MRQTIDVHKQRQRYDRAIAILKEDPKILKSNQRTILKFAFELQAEGIKIVRITKYIYLLRHIAKLLREEFEGANENDIKRITAEINKSDYSDWTKSDYRVAIKRFYRWLRKLPNHQNPPETAWLTIGTSNGHVLPEELLDENEILKLAGACENSRDRALVLTLAESGCRIAEVLTLRCKHVMFDRNGAVLIVTGKTGDRRVRIIAAAPALSEWIKNHPLPDPDAPLWVNIGVTNHDDPLLYPAVRQLLKRLAKKAGIQKRIYPHLFRHSRATFLSSHFTEAQLESYLGWLPGSKMSRIYVHLSGRDTDGPLLAMHGLSKDHEPELKLKTTQCPRCEYRNEPTAKFCGKCAMPLGIEAALKIEENRNEADSWLNLLLCDPDVKDLLARKLREIISSQTRQGVLPVEPQPELAEPVRAESQPKVAMEKRLQPQVEGA
jgi:integrase